MEHTAHLDVAELLLFVVSFNKFATFVALAELCLALEGLQLNLYRRDGLEENVFADGLNGFNGRCGGCGPIQPIRAIRKIQLTFLVIFAANDTSLQFHFR